MVILITGNSKMGRALKEKFIREGHEVIMAERAEHIEKLLAPDQALDMLVTGVSSLENTDGGGILSKLDWQKAELLYEANAVQSLTAVQRAFPHLEQGTLKRICYLNLISGSINASMKKDNFGLSMSACAVNMQINLLYNRMRKLGYTFRLFGMEEEGGIREQASAAYWYFIGNRSVDRDSEKHTDENRLVMRDKNGREIPF